MEQAGHQSVQRHVSRPSSQSARQPSRQSANSQPARTAQHSSQPARWSANQAASSSIVDVWIDRSSLIQDSKVERPRVGWGCNDVVSEQVMGISTINRAMLRMCMQIHNRPHPALCIIQYHAGQYCEGRPCLFAMPHGEGGGFGVLGSGLLPQLLRSLSEGMLARQEVWWPRGPLSKGAGDSRW